MHNILQTGNFLTKPVGFTADIVGNWVIPFKENGMPLGSKNLYLINNFHAISI